MSCVLISFHLAFLQCPLSSLPYLIIEGVFTGELPPCCCSVPVTEGWRLEVASEKKRAGAYTVILLPTVALRSYCNVAGRV